MAIKDIYNSIGKVGKKVAGSIGDYFAPTTYKAPASSQMASVASAVPPVGYRIQNRGVDLNDDDFNAIRPVIYGEVSNRTPDKQELEAHVILNTALNRVKEYNARGQKKTLADVVAMPNQYQAYGGEQYKAYSNPPDVVAAAKKKQIDAILDKIQNQVRTGQYEDNTQGAYYYVHNPDGSITYDSKRQLFAK